MTTQPNSPWARRSPGTDPRPPDPSGPAPAASSGGWPPPGGDYPPPGGYPPPPGGGYPPPPGGGYPGGGYPGGGYPGSGYPGGDWNQGYGQPGQYGDLAGWWSRVGATLIDLMIVGIPAFILGYAASGGTVGARASVEVIVVVAEALYFTLMLSRSGRTVGNMAVGTRVIDARTGGPVSTGKALGRWAAQLLFGLLSVAFFVPTLLDYLWPLWDRRNQTLHDKMAGTLVVYYR